MGHPAGRTAGESGCATSSAGVTTIDVYRASPGDLLVVDVRGGNEVGYWGEILSEAALVRGLGELVITGGVRDIDRIAALGFSVFAANVCIRGTSKEPVGDGC